MVGVSTKLDPPVRQLARQIGEAIRAARLAAGISQASLASAVGMTRTNFARVEYGRTNLTIETILRIAGGLGLEVSLSLHAPAAGRAVKAGSSTRRR